MRNKILLIMLLLILLNIIIIGYLGGNVKMKRLILVLGAIIAAFLITSSATAM